MVLVGFLGYAKLTSSNLNIPLKLLGVTAFYVDFINGCLSIILNILAAATFPIDIFFKAGVNWMKQYPV
jgi:hypothetical protein